MRRSAALGSLVLVITCAVTGCGSNSSTSSTVTTTGDSTLAAQATDVGSPSGTATATTGTATTTATATATTTATATGTGTNTAAATSTTTTATATTTSTTTAATSSTASPSATHASTHGASSSTVMACRSGMLDVSSKGWSGATGHTEATLVFTNTSGVACSVRGYPGVDMTFNGAVRHASRITTGFFPQGATSVTTVVLAPGQQASAIVEGVNNPDGSGQCSSTAQVTAPNTYDAATVSLPQFYCYKLAVHPVARA